MSHRRVVQGVAGKLIILCHTAKIKGSILDKGRKGLKFLDERLILRESVVLQEINGENE